MSVFDRLRQRLTGASSRRAPGEPTATVVGPSPSGPVPISVPAPISDPASAAAPAERPAPSGLPEEEERALWAQLREDPNDVEAFHRLADHVRQRAGDSLDVSGGDIQRAKQDAVWSLAEELAHSGKAWYPLIELARLSVLDDREAALRRLGTAADRDPTGQALATALAMLREAGLPSDALNLGMGHWRPREHSLDAARQLVEASIESGRLGEARRHLASLEGHADVVGVEELTADLQPLIDAAEASMPPRTPAGGLPLIDLRDLREAPRG